MAIDITLAPLVNRTTTTYRWVQPHHLGERPIQGQDQEVDTKGVGSTVDLGDNRSVSLLLFAQNDGTHQGYVQPALTVTVEASPDGVASWEECARFDVVHYDQGRTVNQRIGFVSPGQYLRASWHIDARGVGEKRAARFSVTGHAVGSAT